jgi:predicted  nucleic acid-binding Zn-ribbon protein
VTSAEAARGALAESVEALGHEIDTQRAAGVRDLEELRKDLAALEATFAQRTERVEAALRHDLTLLAEDARDRTADLGETLEKAAARVTDALHDLDRELEEADQESQGARRDLVPIFQDLEGRIEALKHAIESVREAANTVGIPF